MAQVKCLYPINEYDFNDLVDIPEEGLTFNHFGHNGKLSIRNYGAGNQIMFEITINTDVTDDDIENVTAQSMADFFSFDLTVVDPEGDDPDVVIPPVESTRIPSLFINDSTYKEYVTSGTYAGQTKIFLYVTNNPENYDVEFSASYHGSITNVSDNNYIPNTWATIDREVDGHYPLILPSNDDNPPKVQPFFVRFVGNTGYSGGSFITFRTNGDDPLSTGGGGGEAVVRTKPLILRVWGNGGHTENSTTVPTTYNSECWMLSQPQFRDFLPFYGNDLLTPRACLVKNYNSLGEEIGTKTVNITVEYLTTTSVMNQIIDYVVEAGLQGFCFLFYPQNSGSELTLLRTKFNEASSKRSLTSHYCIEDLGYGYSLWPSTSYDYGTSVNHIANQMGQDYWLRVDGKPVLMWRAFNSQINDTTSTDWEGTNYRNYMLTSISRIKARCTELYPSLTSFYIVLECEGYENGAGFLSSNGFDAINWYYSYPTTYVGQNFFNMIEGTQDEIDRHEAAGVPVAPTITTGKNDNPRLWYLKDGEFTGNYLTELSTLEHLPSLINTVVSYMNSSSSSKVGYVSMADENTEQSFVFFPRKRANGTINDGIQKKFKETLNP